MLSRPLVRRPRPKRIKSARAGVIKMTNIEVFYSDVAQTPVVDSAKYAEFVVRFQSCAKQTAQGT
jgi:hypothetical protein